MKELLRLQDICQKKCLQNYNLSVYQGEIVCVQSESTNSIDQLVSILLGEIRAEKGRIFLNGKECVQYTGAKGREQGIFVLSITASYAEYLTILETVDPLKGPLHLNPKSRIRKKVQKYLDEANVRLDADMKIWKLTDVEKKKVGILMAKASGAGLAVLDLGWHLVEGQEFQELRDLILQMHREGMTFLILSSRYSELFTLATRTQYLYMGRAVKEWTYMPDKVTDLLLYGRQNKIRLPQGAGGRRMIGLIDSEWGGTLDAWEYLTAVREINPTEWDSFFGLDLPGAGRRSAGQAIFIPAGIQDHLLDNLTLGKNLTITASRRVCYGKTDIINPKLDRILQNDLCRRYQLPPPETSMSELTPLQRKLVSVARFEVLKPKLIFMETPYSGVGMEEMELLHDYLNELVKKEIQIVYVRERMELLQRDCRQILITRQGKISTIEEME